MSFATREQIEKTKKELVRVSDMKDEYKFWDEDTTTKNFGQLLIGYTAILKGVIELLKRAR